MPSLNAWQRGRGKMRIKIISFLMIISFVFPYTSFVYDARVYAATAEAAPGKTSLKANGAVIKIPAKHGIITGSFKGASGRTVVYIQDLHCNYEVQTNIAAIIRLLAERNQLRLIGVEGDSEKVDVSLLSAFPIKKVQVDLGQYFMRQGLITGAEYQAGTGDKPLALEGIEDQDLYQANRKSLLAFLNEESQGYCEDLREALQRLKKPLYNMGLARMDHKREEYDYENITLENYCNFLLGEARRQKEKTASLKALTLYSVNHRLPLSATLDYEHLLEDAGTLDRALRRKLYTSPEQRQLDHYLYLLKVMESMVNISATEKDLKYFRAHRKEFSAAVMLRFLEKVCYRYVIEPDIDTGVLKLDEFLAQAAEFYKVADQRSPAFVRNLLKHMGGHKQKLAVLITGGFHAPQVEQALRQNKVSYVAIKPRITRTDVPNPYFSLIRDKRTPLDQLLARKEKLIALATGFLEKRFKRHLIWAGKVKSHLHVMLVEKLKGRAATTRVNEVNEEYMNALNEKGVLTSELREMIENTGLEFCAEYSDLGKRIYTYQIKGQKDVCVVLRPDDVIIGYSALLMMPEVGMPECGFVMQVISLKNMRKHSAEILGLKKESGTAVVMAYLANLPVEIRQQVAGWFGAGQGVQRALPDLSTGEDDIIIKALAWAEQFGYGPRLVGDFSFEMDLSYIFNLAGKEAEAGRMDLQRFINNDPACLAMLGIEFEIKKRPFLPGTPDQGIATMAKYYLEAERLAAKINDGTHLEELMNLGNSQLAQLVQAITNKEESFRLGSHDPANPVCPMTKYYSPAQRAAIKKMVEDSNIKLVVSGMQFNPLLGFYPSAVQVMAAYEELVAFAGELGAKITIPLEGTRFERWEMREIMDFAEAAGVGISTAVRPEPIFITAEKIPEVLAEIASMLESGMLPQSVPAESRFIKVLFSRVESFKVARFLTGTRGYLAEGISFSLWAGMGFLLGGILCAEAAVRTGISITAFLAPNGYFGFKAKTGPVITSPWVISVMKSEWMEKNCKSATKWHQVQGGLIFGLLRVMNLVMVIDSSAVESVLTILGAMPGEKRVIQIEINGKMKTMEIPAMIFEEKPLLRRLQGLHVLDENGKPLEIAPRKRMSLEEAA